MFNLMALLLLLLAVLSFPFLIFHAVRITQREAKQAHEEMQQDFDSTLRAYGVESYEVIVEKIQPAVDTQKSGHIRRILFDSRGQYYLYLYYTGHRGVLKPLSRERALLAAGTRGEIKM